MRTIKSTRYRLLTVCLLLLIGHTALAQESAAGINQRLDRIERLIQSQGLLDMLQQLETLQQEIKSLRGEMEIQNHTIEQLQRRQRALYTDIDQRMQNVERPGAGPVTMLGDSETIPDTTGGPPLQTLTPVYSPVQPPATTDNAIPLEIVDVETETRPMGTGMPPAERVTPTPVPTITRPTAQAPVTQIPPPMTSAPMATAAGSGMDPGLAETRVIDPAEARAEYDQAFSLLKQAQYEQAIRAFREFLAQYAGSEYSDNAQYWLGEAFYVMRRFEEAIAEYEQLVSRHPDSQKYTHALLKIGYSYQEMGMIEDAKQYLQILVQSHPETTASRLAGERLQQIAIMEQQAPASD